MKKGLTCLASVGGLLTPVGSPPNLIGRELITQETGEEIPFFTWMLLAFPVVAVMFVALCIVLIRLNKPETKRIEGAEVPAPFRGVAIAMVTAGLMALAFMGFAGLDKYQ